MVDTCQAATLFSQVSMVCLNGLYFSQILDQLVLVIIRLYFPAVLFLNQRNMHLVVRRKIFNYVARFQWLNYEPLHSCSFIGATRNQLRIKCLYTQAVICFIGGPTHLLCRMRSPKVVHEMFTIVVHLSFCEMPLCLDIWSLSSKF